LAFTKTPTGPGFVMDNNIVIANYSGVDIDECYFGMTMENMTTGVITDVISPEAVQFPSLKYKYPVGYVIPLPADLEIGTYKLRPAFRV
ncbi:MAG: hypothetical protein K2F77_00480, partial [Muribaculaceae bacterium]|nr:hypothetical protein [Muribaculaceae bacterium]